MRFHAHFLEWYALAPKGWTKKDAITNNINKNQTQVRGVL